MIGSEHWLPIEWKLEEGTEEFSGVMKYFKFKVGYGYMGLCIDQNIKLYA